METYFVNTPRAKGIKRPDKVEVFVSLLGHGKENAIKRSDLVERCVGAGLIDKETKDKIKKLFQSLQETKEIKLLQKITKTKG